MKNYSITNKLSIIKMINPNLIKVVTIALFFCGLHVNALAQLDIPGQIQNGYTDLTQKKLVNSPNTAAFTQTTKIPVSLFTGQPQITVPLYDIKVDNVDVPVYLNYNARGVQPNNHAGWVGTNWHMVADAVITRKVNGAPDELVAPYSYGSFMPGDGDGWYWLSTTNKNLTNTTDWASANALLNNYTGIISLDSRAIMIDAAADEFDFSVNGLSGTFFMGEDGKWKVRSKDAQTITVACNISKTQRYQFSPFLNIGPSGTNYPTGNILTFLSFTLTAGDGTQYIFGDDPSISNTTNAIEFNRAGVRYTSPNINVVASAWHIKQIILPSGKKITYEYKRDGHQYVYDPTANNAIYGSVYVTADGSSSGGGSGNDVDINDANMNITDPVYLTSITFPEGSLKFNSAPSLEQDLLDSPMSDYSINTQYVSSTKAGQAIANTIVGAYFNELSIPLTNQSPDPYAYLKALQTTNPNKFLIPSNWYQLNDIELDDYNGNKLKDVKLTYTTDANTRKFLQSVQTFAYYNNSSGVSTPPYTFQYNTTPLPKYCTNSIDHWGFYNNGPSALGVNDPGYNASRTPNFTYTQAGILTQITYPTGGYSQFNYEPNQYDSYVGGLPIAVTPVSLATGPGLRVDSILVKDNATSNLIKYEYKYVNNLTSNTCSGVLGSPPAVYAIPPQSLILTNIPGFSSINYTVQGFSQYTNHTIYPASSDDANVVSYTNVIERQSRNGVYNGMTITNFSNHDNGYADSTPDGFVYIMSIDGQLCNYSERGFERGNVLNETYYDNLGNPVKSIQNTYNNDPARFNQFVKSIKTSLRFVTQPQNGNGGVDFIRYSAIRNYTFYPYLQQSVETDYPSDHSANTRATITNYSYDAVNGTKNLIQTLTIDNKGQNVLTNTQYALDYHLLGITPADAFSKGVYNLQQKLAVSLPVETTTQLSNADGSNLRAIASSLNSYHPQYPFPNLIYRSASATPILYFSQSSVSSAGLTTMNGSYEPKVYIDSFDMVGNPLQEHSDKGINQAYQWGYNNNYLVAVCKNASVSEFYFNNCEDNPNNVLGIAHTGHRYTTNASVVWGLPNSRTYVISYWYRSNGIWKFSGEKAYTPVSNVFVMTGGDAFDDIRIYPADAQMTTYTYEPLIGMSSAIDAKGETTYYEYDFYQRLMNIRDKNKNIIKSYCYNYAGQQSNCYINLPSYTNSAQSGAYTASCSAGYAGTTVTYTVPSGTYTSNVSLQDANNQALADVAANGQSYANANGTCSVAPLTFTTTNYTSSSFTGHFSSASNTYNFTINPSGTTTTSILPGLYYVTINPINAGPTYKFLLGSRAVVSAPNVTYSSPQVNVSSGGELSLVIQLP